MATAVVPRETPPEMALGSTRVVKAIDLDHIDVGPNVRVDPGELQELADSIRELGVLQPIKVRANGSERWVIVWGQRRYLAAKQAGLVSIPAFVDDSEKTPAKLSIEQLSENLQRKDLNPIEEAVALREVLDADPHLTQAELAKRLGRSAPWVANTLRLLNLHEEVQQLVRAEQISASHGRAMASLPAKQQRALAQRVVAAVKAGRPKSSKDLETEISWKQTEVSQEEHRQKKTRAWIPKAIAALEAAKVPKDAEVALGDTWDVDAPAIRAAVKKAGWTNLATQWRPARPPKGKCDCTSVRLRVGGRKAEIEPTCSDDRHIDRDRNAAHVQDRAEREAQERRLEQLAPALEAALRDAPPHPAVLRLVTFVIANDYWGPSWDDYVKRDQELLATELVEKLTSGYQLRRVDLVALLGEFGVQASPVELPAETKKPAKGKKAKAAA